MRFGVLGTANIGQVAVCPAIRESEHEVLAVASRDTDFKPVLEAAAQRGLGTVAIAPGEHGRSDALRNAAQDAITL